MIPFLNVFGLISKEGTRLERARGNLDRTFIGPLQSNCKCCYLKYDTCGTRFTLLRGLVAEIIIIILIHLFTGKKIRRKKQKDSSVKKKKK